MSSQRSRPMGSSSAGPRPVSFDQLLKIATTSRNRAGGGGDGRSKEHVDAYVPEKVVKKRPQQLQRRPMTQREKDLMIEEAVARAKRGNGINMKSVPGKDVTAKDAALKAAVAKYMKKHDIQRPSSPVEPERRHAPAVSGSCTSKSVLKSLSPSRGSTSSIPNIRISSSSKSNNHDSQDYGRERPRERDSKSSSTRPTPNLIERKLPETENPPPAFNGRIPKKTEHQQQQAIIRDACGAKSSRPSDSNNISRISSQMKSVPRPLEANNGHRSPRPGQHSTMRQPESRPTSRDVNNSNSKLKMDAKPSNNSAIKDSRHTKANHSGSSSSNVNGASRTQNSNHLKDRQRSDTGPPRPAQPKSVLPSRSAPNKPTTSASRPASSTNRPPTGPPGKDIPRTNGSKSDIVKSDKDKKEKPKPAPKISAAERKKLFEQELLEKKRQKLRDEAERIKLRNLTLAGKKSTDELQQFLRRPEPGRRIANAASNDSAVRRPQPPSSSENNNRQSVEAAKRASLANGRVASQTIENKTTQSKSAAASRPMPPPRPPRPTSIHLNPYMDEYDARRSQKYSTSSNSYRPTTSKLARSGGYSKNYSEYDDDEDEEDEEMNDFIDDGDRYEDHEEEISKYIKDIFGYDKRKYLDLDDDDDDLMESSYAQQAAEEMRSTKIGIKEDLEDMRIEAEEKKRKALRQKRMRIIESDSD